MQLQVFADADTVARQAAQLVAAEARSAVAARGRFVCAISGGHTPWQMLRALGAEQLPWNEVHIVQVDERVAPAGHTDRNLTHLRECLLDQSRLPEQNLHPMPVNDSDLDAAAARYAQTLHKLCGPAGQIDLVHLGLGADGHTASLVPGDPVLAAQTNVAVTGVYQGRRRMTLTYPPLNRARHILWLTTGAGKQEMLARLLQQDRTIPAGRVAEQQAVVYADRDAAAKLQPAS